MSATAPDPLIVASLGLLVNLGGKHVGDSLPTGLVDFLKNILVQKFVVFAIAFIFSKDFQASVIVTGAFIALTEFGLFPENKQNSGMNEYFRDE